MLQDNWLFDKFEQLPLLAANSHLQSDSRKFAVFQTIGLDH
jgi:hypothetical protein